MRFGFDRDGKRLTVKASIFDGKMPFEFACIEEAPTEIDAQLRLAALQKEFNRMVRRKATDRARNLYIKWKKEGGPPEDEQPLSLPQSTGPGKEDAEPALEAEEEPAVEVEEKPEAPSKKCPLPCSTAGNSAPKRLLSAKSHC